MTPLWQWQAVLEAVQGHSDAAGIAIHGISIDSRSVVPGDLFIALSGQPAPGFSGGTEAFRDGHDFVAAAAEAGAAAALVSKVMAVNIPQIVVDDTFTALWQLGRAGRARLSRNAKVVAITGSAGKTTLRAWLQELLASYGGVHASVGSYNNHWGVPLSLARMPQESEFGVFEVGTNHPGEISPLSNLVSPHIAVLLNVLPAHLGNFPDMEALKAEKLSIADGLVEDGLLVVLDTVVGDQRTDDHTMTFGFGDKADVRGAQQDRMLQVTDGSAALQLAVPPGFGEHRLQTVLASVAVLRALKLKIDQVTDQLMGLGSPKGRGNQLAVGDVTIIDDSYTANPVSTRYALDALLAARAQRRVVLLGEMLELGAASAEMHLSLRPALQQMDEVYTFGDGLDGVAEDLSGFSGHYETCADFDMAAFVRQRRQGDVILVKGSNKVFWTQHFVDTLYAQLKESGV